MELATVAIGRLRENPNNPREHPPKQIEALVEALRTFGQMRPILVRKANMMIVAGHGVYRACVEAGLNKVEVALWDVDQRTADLFMIGDNRLAELGQTDDDKLVELMRSLAPENYLALGYSVADVEELLGEKAAQAEAAMAVETIEASDLQDLFWISVKGPMRDQALALQKLRGAMADLPDVDVTLGTRLDIG